MVLKSHIPRFFLCLVALSLLSPPGYGAKDRTGCERSLKVLKSHLTPLSVVQKDFAQREDSICSKWPKTVKWQTQCSNKGGNSRWAIEMSPNFEGSFLEGSYLLKFTLPLRKNYEEFAKEINTLTHYLCQRKRKMESCSPLTAIEEITHQNVIYDKCGELSLREQKIIINTRLSHEEAPGQSGNGLSSHFEVQPTALIPKKQSKSELARAFRHRYFCEAVETQWQQNLNWFYLKKRDPNYLIHRNLSFSIKGRSVLKGDRGTYLVQLIDGLRNSCP